MKPSLVARLMLAYAFVIAALLVSAWWSQRSLADAELAAGRLSDRSVQGIELAAGLESLMHGKGRLADYLLSGDPRALADIRPHRQDFQAWIEEMNGFAHTEEERALLARMRAGYAAYTAQSDDVIRLQQAGAADEARRRFSAMANEIEDVLAEGQQLLTLAGHDMLDRRRIADAAIVHGRTIILWLTGLGAVFSLGLGFMLSRYAARPIYRLVLRLGSSGVIDQLHVDGNEMGALETQVTALLERVRQQERALQQAQKLSELGEIASEIAHETLNPVTGVKGMLQALRRTVVSPERLRQELADMERQLGRVADIVGRLMRYARPLEPHSRRVLVRGVLDRAARSARLAPGAGGRTIRVAAVTDGLEWEMDPDLIEQVLTNLLVNGCEASPPGAAIDLSAQIEDGRLNLSVRDHGMGIAPAIRERLFHPFCTTKPNGNGLGLAVSRNIVLEHGGQIDVEVAQPGGTVFRVLLPAKAG